MACPLFCLVVFLSLSALQLITYCKATLIEPFSVSVNRNLKDGDTFWHVKYDPENIQIHMNTMANISLRIEGFSADQLSDYATVQLRSERDHVATVPDGQIKVVEIANNGSFEGGFNISAVFLGSTNLYVEVRTKSNQTVESSEKLPVTVIREERAIDHIFTGSVAVLVCVLYINFGAAMDLPTVKAILVRPIGPIIGFFSQFLFMPLLSYGLGLLLFPDNFEMQLGLFFTGVSPGGGASNIWTVLLGANLNLSLAMTTISTLAAFGMMPLWIFTLGRQIFDRGNLVVPYKNLATFAVGLIIPLGIGLLSQRYTPRIARILVRILKPMSALLIIFIVVFAIVTNLYLFELFSWQIIAAGLGLPWIGYLFGFLASKTARLPTADALAISVETGIQNTGIAIFLLRFSLPQPAADLTTVVPVSAAIMTPVPLLILYLCLKLREKCAVRQFEMMPKSPTDESLTKDQSSN
ncbi:ileal sodium/bile acid cotransporter-like [Malaya genurostris]|uniref:ileal sodium/bile acid cotransporter-like n=1 Tax=Malaya genurostris TaxID=325434 RepID=UPI0026F3A081|nr:ileal sodium/bile acid cotransporter-like [Malaya genurostris]XP_058461781.1 ileal sodium/bile acid cotransporter-like [Malaya genurostris]